MKKCEKCKHGEVNFWGYDECWLYNQEMDFETTIHTAEREKTAEKLNRYGRCTHYKRPTIFDWIKGWIDYIKWSIFE